MTLYRYLPILLLGAFATTSHPAVAGPEQSTGLLRHWNFDEPASAGTVVDGREGKAVELDGVDDHVPLGNLGEHDAVTVAFWMKPADVDSDQWQALVSSEAWEEGVLHVPMRAGRVDVHMHLGETARGRVQSGIMKQGTWYHVAVVADAGQKTLRLFVNGVEEDFASLRPLSTQIKLLGQVVGREFDGRAFSRYYRGAIDEVRIYGRALGVDEIRALCPDAVPLLSRDPRNILNGRVIPDEGYCDQPYLVILDDGSWLCTMTTGPGREGQTGQHVVSVRSTDQGRTWEAPVDIEPSGEIEASWVVPLKVPGGRVYGFYTYNGDNVHHLKGKPIRADVIGWYAYKYTDDGGRSWSAERYRLPMPLAACDRGNDFEGEVQIFWGIDKPQVVADGDAMFAFTRLGKFMLDMGEGWFYRSDNILTEDEVDKLRWELLPVGDRGLRAERFGSVQEEHNLVELSDGTLYCVYRTGCGYPCHSYSHDGGRTWTEPEPMTYTPGGRIVKTPRACPMLFKCDNGKFLFWYHNNTGKGGTAGPGRNPVWMSGGVERDGKLHWSQPEILLYNPDPKGRGMSYPDLIEQHGRYFVSETQKTVARVHEVDATLLAGLWGQWTEGPTGEGTEEQRETLHQASSAEPHASSGLSLDFDLRTDELRPGDVLLDSRDEQGRGTAVTVTESRTLEVSFCDGETTARWDTDPGVIEAGEQHHVTVLLDAGPRVLMFVVDGLLCDGGEHRAYGFGQYIEELGDISGSGNFRTAPAVTLLKVYDRCLRVSEAVAGFGGR